MGLQIRVLHRDAPVWRKLSRIDFDPTSGEVRRIRDAAKASASAQFESILGPLHFGYYGSPLLGANAPAFRLSAHVGKPTSHHEHPRTRPRHLHRREM